MPPATTVEAFAPAKVNLTLHVTGRRDDGYHLLDSLVVFAGIGDTVQVAPAPEIAFAVTGPMAAGVPVGADNLVLRAARLFGETPARITLTKRLPAAAGVGGGSSDAAACLRGLAEMTGRPLPEAGAALSLGADVPVCLAARPARMSGIGEQVVPVAPMPPAWLVLVNPGVAVPTGAVFAALAGRGGAPMPTTLPRWPDAAALAAWLATQRNDLEPPARRIAPEIDAVLAALTGADALIARMSGSGATCFGLFGGEVAAQGAAERISAARPDWWVAAAPMLS